MPSPFLLCFTSSPGAANEAVLKLLLILVVLLQVNKFDWLVFNGAFLGVIFAGVDIGLAIGIGMSIIIALWHTAFPKTVALGQLPHTSVYR